MKEPAMGRTLFEKTSTNTQKVKKKVTIFQKLSGAGGRMTRNKVKEP